MPGPPDQPQQDVLTDDAVPSYILPSVISAKAHLRLGEARRLGIILDDLAIAPIACSVLAARAKTRDVLHRWRP